jgi:hypothetical protein
MIPTIISKDVLDAFVKELEAEIGLGRLPSGVRETVENAINLWQARVDKKLLRLVVEVERAIYDTEGSIKNV